MKSVLIDSSVFYSLENPDEPDHERALSEFRRLITTGTRLFTTNFVFDETYTLLLVRLGRATAVEWGRGLLASDVVQMLRVDPDHEARAWEIILQFADKDFSYTDATTFALAESLEIDEALSLDRHFHRYGALKVIP